MNKDQFRSTYAHLSEFNKFLEELNKESDRGAALISTAMIDDLLERIIAAFLSRILAAYSLGLISEEEYDECNWLRGVRNEFAHKVHQRFADQKLSDLCSNLRFAAKQIPNHPNLPRAQFLTSATALILHLTNRPHYVSQKRLTFTKWPF